MNYCSQCGESVDLQKISGDDRPRHYCANCDTIHYQNPKLVVGCLPVWEEKVLLCKRAIEPKYGLWNLPCGYLELGETVEEGAIRETREEANAEVELLGPHAIFSLPHISQVYMHFLARLINGEYGVGDETLEAGLFAEDEIPWEDIAFSSSTFALKKYFENRQKGEWNVHYSSTSKHQRPMGY